MDTNFSSTESLTEKKENYLEVKIENGIVHIIYTHEHYTEQMIDAAIKQTKEVTKGESYVMFVDIRKVKSSTRGARKRLAQKDAKDGTIAAAILINSDIQRVIYNFFNTVFTAPAPTKLFTDKEKAMEWLINKEYLNMK